jgi:MFS family permease
VAKRVAEAIMPTIPSGTSILKPTKTKSVPSVLARWQIMGFWGAWLGNMLDGTDIQIASIALAPALIELLPNSGYSPTAGTVGYAASVLFAAYLVGWGLSFLWGPLVDEIGRVKMLALCVALYASFTAAGGLAHNVWQFGLFRFLAGFSLGGEWAAAGTYVAEAWPEDRRKMGAGYLHSGFYFGTLFAGALSYFVSAAYGWRGLLFCGLTPVIASALMFFRMREPDRWRHRVQITGNVSVRHRFSPLAEIFDKEYFRTTLVMASLMTVASAGLWAGATYLPTAVTLLAREQGLTTSNATSLAAEVSVVMAIGTILGCILAPWLAECLGRKKALATYYALMILMIPLTWGWAFYLPPRTALPIFVTASSFLGLAGGSFALFTLWLPELYGTGNRGTGFAFCTTVCRFFGAGINFSVGAAIRFTGTLGKPLACIAIVFVIGLTILPFAEETRGRTLPE